MGRPASVTKRPVTSWTPFAQRSHPHRKPRPATRNPLRSLGLSPLPKRFYLRPPDEVARDLLGKYLVQLDGQRVVGGRIVETEAYFGVGDRASHSFRGRTPRNAAMFGPGGRAYVYFTYGNHYLLNVVTGRSGEACAVLIRALEPLFGLAAMRRRRGPCEVKNLTSGPGKLTQALGVGAEHNFANLRSSDLVVAERQREPAPPCKRSRRVGIRQGTDRQGRFFVPGNRFVSAKPNT